MDNGIVEMFICLIFRLLSIVNCLIMVVIREQRTSDS